MGKALVGGLYSAVVPTPNTTKNTPLGALFTYSDATESYNQFTAKVAGVLSNLGLRVTTNSLTTAAYTTKIRVNGANGNQVVSVSAGQTGFFTDSSNTDALADGDEVSTQTVCASGGSGNSIIRGIVCAFAASSGHALHFTSVADANIALNDASATRYLQLVGKMEQSEGNSSEDPVEVTLRQGGTLSGYFLNVIENPRTATTFRVRVNGADGNQTISVGGGVTGLLRDTSNSDTVASGDTINHKYVTGTGTDNLRVNVVAVAFTSSGDGSDIFNKYQSQGDARAASATTDYLPIIGGWLNSGLTTESAACTDHGFAGTASKMRVSVSSNSYSAAATIKFRKNGSDGNQSISITASTTGLFEDASNTDDFLETDDCCYSWVGGTSGSQALGWLGLLEVPITSVTVNDERDAHIVGAISTGDERDARLSGQAVATDERDAVIHGTASTSDERDARIDGGISSNDERDMRMSGIATTNSERDAIVTGSLPSNDERDATINGQAATGDERDARMSGVDTTDDERDAKVTGALSSSDTRSAKITGHIVGNKFQLGRDKNGSVQYGTLVQ